MALGERMRAVITGAGSGLGRALALEVARRGGSVLVTDVRGEAAEETVRLVRDAGARAEPMVVDVAKLGDVVAMGDRAEDVLGGVDLLVNNAGVAVGGLVGEIAIEDWQWIVGINLWGVIHGCHVFVPRMKKAGRGHVINVASAAGLVAPGGMGPYNVTKSAVVALSETLDAELAGSGVGVSVLCPTFFPTNIAEAARGSDGRMKAVARKLMAKSKLQAPDVARAALDSAARGDLYVVPMSDGRWMWRIKRLHPQRFQRMAPKVLDRLIRTLDRG